MEEENRDDPLYEIVKKKVEVQSVDNVITGAQVKVGNVNEESKFTEAVDEAKLNVLKESAQDAKFVAKFKENTKDAAAKLAEVEKTKAELEKQNVDYHKELLETQQKLNIYEAEQHSWENKTKRRQYHYDGVKPIMKFVGIDSPMNLVLLYLLTIVLTPFYLIAKLIRGPIGTLLAGAEDGNRSKTVRGFLWTLLAIIIVLILGIGVVLALQWLGIMPRLF